MKLESKDKTFSINKTGPWPLTPILIPPSTTLGKCWNKWNSLTYQLYQTYSYQTLSPIVWLYFLGSLHMLFSGKERLIGRVRKKHHDIALFLYKNHCIFLGFWECYWGYWISWLLFLCYWPPCCCYNYHPLPERFSIISIVFNNPSDCFSHMT